MNILYKFLHEKVIEEKFTTDLNKNLILTSRDHRLRQYAMGPSG